MPVGKKICKECGTPCGVRLQECYCGYQFPVKGGGTRPPKVVKAPKAPKLPKEPKAPKLKIINTYDTPGQGRKECGKCHKYVGAILKACICGSTEFIKKAIQLGPKPIQLHEEPGKGRKQCAGCHKYIASVLLKCACGSTEFVKRVVEPKAPKAVQTYSEAGPGRKQCAKCSQFMAAVHKHCACGSEEFVKKVEVYDKSGRGRKECPGCKIIVGRTVEVCPSCQHEFPPVEEIETAKKDRFDLPSYVDIEASRAFQKCGCGNRLILAPAGDAPKLNSTDADAVCAWMEKTIKQGHEIGLHYSPAALRSFASRQYDRNGEEFDTIICHLNNCVTGVDAQNDDLYEDQDEVTDDDALGAELAAV